MADLLHAVLLLCLRLTLPPRAQDSRPNTIVADRQAADAVPPAARAAELYAARDLASALPAAEDAADRAWQEFGGDDSRTIAAQEFLAHLAALNKDPERARILRAETDRKLARLGNPALAEKVRITRAEDYRDTAEGEK